MIQPDRGLGAGERRGKAAVTPGGLSPPLAQESRKASWRSDASFQFGGTDRDLGLRVQQVPKQ